MNQLAIITKGEETMNHDKQEDVTKSAAILSRKTVRLPRELAEQLKRHAERNNLSYNRAAIQCIEYALTHLDKSDDTGRQ